MKGKIKENLKSYLPGFILGVISACTISVIAATYFPSNDVTYDNSSSGLESTNVQGAIDELYTVCTYEPTAGEQIIEDAGLEKDSYEDRYFFTGANPNNYITFNDEKAGWRIISVEADGSIKIMRNASIGNYAWDSSSSSNWSRPATLNTYLNGDYYNSLNSMAQSQIVSHDWSIGSIIQDNNNLASQINDENSTTWNGKIALPTVSEYLRSNSNTSQCGTLSLLNNYSTCKNTTWMLNVNIYTWFTLTTDANDSFEVFTVIFYGDSTSTDSINLTYGIRPTIYLSSDIKITGGTGSQSDPYTIE